MTQIKLGDHEAPYILTQVVYVGYYQIGGASGIRLSFASKPSWLHRTMSKLLLGWKWVDA
jgi:hypothetical protein